MQCSDLSLGSTQDLYWTGLDRTSPIGQDLLENGAPRNARCGQDQHRIPNGNPDMDANANSCLRKRKESESEEFEDGTVRRSLMRSVRRTLGLRMTGAPISAPASTSVAISRRSEPKA